jgi:Domain of unknown function DUF29
MLEDSRNLRNFVEHAGYAKAYQFARAFAAAEMRLERNAWHKLFPEVCESDLDSVLNDEFFPPPASNGHSR